LPVTKRTQPSNFKFTTETPRSILTPDSVETRLGAPLRLYGTQQSWFDKMWKPGEFELVN
jgi:hypothetical protein